MLKRFSIIGVTILVAFFYARYKYEVIHSQIESGVSEEASSDLILKNLPDISFETLEGETFSLREKSKKSGSKFLFVHFWGTWCAPCEAEFPELLKFISKVKNEKVVFYLVAINDEIPKIQSFLKRFKLLEKLDITFLIDNSGLYFEKFGTAKVPETYVFKIENYNSIHKFTGPQEWDKDYYLNFVDSL